ncbi:patatin-like phospholipase family protein [Planomonospora alba]|uniref:Patatin-like phospholipase family protein n=1 Tax=Planomonospora alba TaxID=161354 RepID=A0ABP6P0J1_9ACTN
MTRALVLGGGGIAGIGWEAGIITGLRREGADLGEADLVVGTSAGSVVGALVAAGADLESAVAAQADAEPRATVPAVDTATGEFTVWERDSGVPLVSAVASSCAVPGVFPPVEINGRRYMDGGVRSTTNADLAEGCSAVVVVEPLAHLTPRAALAAETAGLGGAEVVHVGPDEAAVAVFGVDVLDPSLWRPAFDAGLAQAPAVAGSVREAWR